MQATAEAFTAVKEGLITDEDLATFHRKGYLISKKLFNDEEIARMRKEHERIWNGERDGDGFASKPEQHGMPKNPLELRKHDSPWWINDYVLHFSANPNIGKIAAALMNTKEVRLWHDQVIWKPGQGPNGKSEAGNIGWHQDFGYWNCCSTTNMVTAWIALQDTDIHNGGMFSIVGSHKWGLYNDEEAHAILDMDKMRRKYTGLGFEWIEEPCILKAGQISFHHSLCFHGSGPNLSNDPRLCVIAHLMPEEARYAGPTQHHTSVTFYPRPKKGEKFRDEFHPLLWREPRQ
jgi:ectoine hydroxylase-related dioxygenase (phytanoyl-CoA dioxygenase family)